MRDLVRQRAAAKADESRAKHRLVKHLLRRGLREPDENGAWTHPWWRWVQSLKFEHEAQQVALGDCIAEVLHMGERLARLDKAIDHLVETAPAHMRAVIEALQALRGVAKLTAVTIVTEVGTFKRFRRPTEMMGYTGFVPSEYSSGGRESKGRLTRTGNAHLRHVLGEAAWHARHRPWLNLRMKKVLPTLPAGVAEIAWKAQERLHRKFTKMTYCRKPAGKVAAAVAREMVGFIWAIGTLVESRSTAPAKPEQCSELNWSAMKRRLNGRGSTERRILVKSVMRFQSAVPSPRQLPTNEDCEVSQPGETLEYQLDHRRQSLPWPLTLRFIPTRRR